MPQRRARLRSVRPAPTKSTTASASSSTTKTACVRCRAPLEPRPPSFKVLFWSGDAVFRAGARPKSTPATMETASVKSRTRESTRTSFALGSACGRAPNHACVPHHEKNAPKAPPATDSSRLSVSNCRMTRRCVAPRTERIANSLARPIARASSRLATFAQAISSTNPTAASNTSSVVWIPWTMRCCRGIKTRRAFLFVPG